MNTTHRLFSPARSWVRRTRALLATTAVATFAVLAGSGSAHAAGRRVAVVGGGIAGLAAATVLAERVGWTGSIRWFRDNVNRVRVDHRPIDPADRLTWSAGDVAQCDLWFPPRKILLEDGSRALLPVLVMTLAYSRFIQ